METWLIILLIILAIIILGLIIYFIPKKSKQSTTNLVENINNLSEKQKAVSEPIKEEIITKITPTTSQFDDIEELTEEKPSNNIHISSKTESDLLRKLELFERNKGYIKKNVNLASLSKQFDTNTKYLSEIIRISRQKQFNAYLNELRVNYIVNRLKNEPEYINTKVSYLASDCGFASHSTFTTTFTQIMNESPSAFIKRIKEEQKNS
ncbi:helix-turn-helix domain-containing protein [Empedobacter brevis]|uniref:helix-turn-helix domain-containing protein n=1 Tax=Empedobacter brevis TaxID=247 RepID=UPI0039AEAA4E